MNAFILLIPLILIRYGLPYFLDKKALVRAAHYPPFDNDKKIFLSLYQLATIALLIIPFFLKVQPVSTITYAGYGIYTLGILILIFSTINFAKPNSHNLNTNGVYRFSRNPMYVGYFVYFLGCTLITHSILMFVVLVIFQVSCHWLILAEENWCLNHFGDEYKNYMKKVRRYL